MKLSGLLCPQGHKVGGITYRMEVDSTERKQVRKLIDNVFYCQPCKKFYKMVLTECDFIPKEAS